MTDYILVTRIPPDWTKYDLHYAHMAVRNGIGRQSGAAHIKTHSRPNIDTQWDDEDAITSAGIMWLIAGVFTAEEQTKTYIVDIVATELDVNPVEVQNKIRVDILTHKEVLQMLIDDPKAWGERTE